MSIVLLSAAYYIAHRLVQPLARDSYLRPVIWAVIFFGTILIIMAPIILRIKPLKNLETSYPVLMKNIMLLTYGFMGLLVITVFSFLLIDLIKLFWTGLFLITKNSNIDPARREFLLSQAPWGAFGISTLLAGWGYADAVCRPQVIKTVISKKDLPASLDGFKIIQISDLHVGSTIKKDYVETVVAASLAEKPDLIAVTGDLVDGYVETLSNDLEPLRQLKATHGVFYVTGNHEYYWGVDAWVKKVKELGFEPLLNKHKLLNHQGANVVIAGVPDIHSHRFNPSDISDPVKAMEGAPNADYAIMLAHQPSSYIQTEKTNCDLQLSGHTHAGQFYPVGFAIRFFHKYYRGLNRHSEKLMVYVNQGSGYWGPPNRLGIPAEITLIQLAKA